MSRKKDTSLGIFRETPGKPKTALEKTSAAAKLIIEADEQKRADLTAKLRAARLERDGKPSPASDDDASA